MPLADQRDQLERPLESFAALLADSSSDHQNRRPDEHAGHQLSDHNPQYNRRGEPAEPGRGAQLATVHLTDRLVAILVTLILISLTDRAGQRGLEREVLHRRPAAAAASTATQNATANSGQSTYKRQHNQRGEERQSIELFDRSNHGS